MRCTETNFDTWHFLIWNVILLQWHSQEKFWTGVPRFSFLINFWMVEFSTSPLKASRIFLAHQLWRSPNDILTLIYTIIPLVLYFWNILQPNTLRRKVRKCKCQVKINNTQRKYLSRLLLKFSSNPSNCL